LPSLSQTACKIVSQKSFICESTLKAFQPLRPSPEVLNFSYHQTIKPASREFHGRFSIFTAKVPA